MSRLRWFWTVWWTVVAVASFLIRDNPPPSWWVFPAGLAVASWVIEFQHSMIEDLSRFLERDEADR